MDETIYYNEPFPYILIDDFYNQSELDGIWEELDYLCHPKRMGRSSIERGAATREGKSLKNAWDMFLDCFFTCLLYTSPSPRDVEESRMPSSA